MPKHIRKKYHSPESLFIMPDQLVFFEDSTYTPDPALEAQRRLVRSELKLIAERHKTEYQRITRAIERLRNAATEPDESGASPPRSRSKRPWQLRPGSNMDVIATMLETAGRKGVSEIQMVERLREMGRLTTASEPQRSVHWSISELRRRALNAVRKDDTKGVRWYAYGNFAEWRGPTA